MCVHPQCCCWLTICIPAVHTVTEWENSLDRLPDCEGAWFIHGLRGPSYVYFSLRDLCKHHLCWADKSLCIKRHKTSPPSRAAWTHSFQFTSGGAVQHILHSHTSSFVLLCNKHLIHVPHYPHCVKMVFCFVQGNVTNKNKSICQRVFFWTLRIYFKGIFSIFYHKVSKTVSQHEQTRATVIVCDIHTRCITYTNTQSLSELYICLIYPEIKNRDNWETLDTV